MPDNKRFDPVGWFASAAMTLLFGAVALAVAVHLIQGVWPWLLGILALGAGIGLLVQLVLDWRRRRW